MSEFSLKEKAGRFAAPRDGRSCSGCGWFIPAKKDTCSNRNCPTRA